MIVRNEEETLPTALASAKTLADEIVIVDTGSEDDTITVAKSLGAKVIEGGDRMHKGESRNIAADNATGDWIVVLDADETIRDPARLRDHIENTDANAVFIKMSDGTRKWHQMRAYRKGKCEYRYRAHEVPVCHGKADYTEFIFDHHQPTERWPWKLTYTMDRLLLDVAENPTDPRPLFYLGRQYSYLKEYHQAIETLKKYLDVAPTGFDAQDACLTLAACFDALGDEAASIESIYRACVAQPRNRWQWYLLGSKYYKNGAYDLATGMLKIALEIKKEVGYERTNEVDILDLLARCLWKLHRFEEGAGFAEMAVDQRPHDKRLLTNLDWFKSKLGDMDAFYRVYGPNVHTNQPRHEIIASLVEGPRILDIGCGTGDLLLLLEGDVHGTDVSATALGMARIRGVEATLHHTEEVPTGPWDTIIISEVLEHIDDTKMVSAALKELNHGGKLIVSVPNRNRVPDPNHVREYTEESLLELLGGGEIIPWEDPYRILAIKRK